MKNSLEGTQVKTKLPSSEALIKELQYLSYVPHFYDYLAFYSRIKIQHP